MLRLRFRLRPVALSVALLVLSGFALSEFATAQTIQINRENKTIAISTTDEATAIADIAAISIGFEIFKPDSDSAAVEAGKLSHAIIDALHKAGIEDQNIESKSQNLYRNTQFDNKETPELRAARQYRFEQSWEVSASPQNAANVIRVAIAAGANQSGNIDWRLADRKALQAKAAANALVKAHSVATQMAEGLQVKLGSLIYASNEVPEARIYFHARLGQGVGGGMGGGIASMMAIPLEIRPQTIREEATVYAVFAIE